jgi:hypothetical protein
MQDVLIQLIGAWLFVEAIYLTLKLTGVLPRYYIGNLKGANGNNNGWRIIINSRVSLGTSQSGVLGQEMAEFDHSGTLSQRILNKYRKDKQQRLEFLGHAVEALIASKEGHNKDLYEKKEASEMYDGYDNLFKDYSQEEIEEQLKLYRQPAKDWYNKHHKRFYKVKDKLNIK